MTTEFMTTDTYDEVSTEIVSLEPPTSSEAFSTHDASVNDSAAASWQVLKTQTTAFFTNVMSYTTAFVKNNQRSLTTLGWVLLTLLGVRLLLGALDAFDDIPLVSPILKLIGFVYLVRFVWRYLIREQNRQELMQTINHARAEMFGSQS